jgi:hypothetical protein
MQVTAIAGTLVGATLLNLASWHAGHSLPAVVYVGIAVMLAVALWSHGGTGKLVLAVIGVSVIIILGSPLTSWDARVIWFFHAKRIYLDNDILAQLDGYIPATHNDYPVLVPAVAASIARSVGYWNEVVPRLAVLTILFPTLAFIAVRINRTNHVLAWLTGVLVIANKLLLNGYMDALLALAVASLGIAYMELQRERPPPRPADRWTLIVLIVLLTMALPHLKNEGMLAVVALGISMGIRSSQGAVPVVASSIAGIGYVAGWRMHVASHGLETDLFAPGIAARAMDRLGDPWALLLIGAWFAIHAGPACVVLVACARTRRAGLPIAEPWVRSIAFVGIYALGMAAIYLTTPNELAWHLETSARRVFLPAVIFVLTIVVHDLTNDAVKPCRGAQCQDS